jgi:ABC-type glycerol-3-phosphate transport system substrate-binding protein
MNPTRRPLRTRTRAVWSACALALVALGAAACSSDDSSAAGNQTTTTTAEPGTARIDQFVVPESVDCNGKTSTKVSVQWSVSGAESQVLLVDGREVSGLDASSGTVEADVHCDPLPHTFVLHVLDDAGHPTTKQVLVTTNL